MFTGGFLVFLVGCGLYITWKFEDPLEFKRETLYAYIFGGIACFVGWLLVLLDPGNVHKNEQFNYNIGMFIALIIFYTFQVPYQCYKASKHLKEATHVDDIRLKDILDNPETHTLFKKYMITEFAVDTVIFLETLKKWKEEIGTMPDGYIRTEAENIYQKFFSVKSVLPLNISIQNSKYIQEKFDQTDKRRSIAVKVEKNVFDPIERELTELIESDSMPRFMKKHSEDVHKLLLVMGTAGGNKFAGGAPETVKGKKIKKSDTKNSTKSEKKHKKSKSQVLDVDDNRISIANPMFEDQ